MPRNASREAWKTYGNVFDGFTERILIKLQGQGHYDEMLGQVALGKEANVFVCSKGEDFVAVKIYRTMNCNFNKMHEYLIHDERYMDIKNNKRKVIMSWVQREFTNLLIARDVIPVPTPYAVAQNVLVMQFIGYGRESSPMLKDKPPKDPQAFYELVRENMTQLKERGLVHGDLSAFNILNHDEKPVFIDFSQATTVKSPNAEELYCRDIENVNAFFEKQGAKTRP
jgi:RIO kinase 1